MICHEKRLWRHLRNYDLGALRRYRISEAQYIVMRTGIFRDGVTRIALVSVMIVTEITVFFCDNVTKCVCTDCRRLSVWATVLASRRRAATVPRRPSGEDGSRLAAERSAAAQRGEASSRCPARRTATHGGRSDAEGAELQLPAGRCPSRQQ